MRWIIFISIMLVFTQPVSAALKKCVDDRGMFHYYDKVLPAECQDKATVEMNNLGVVIRKNEIDQNKVDPAAEKALKAQKEEEELRLKEEQRRDTVLLSTYTSEQEIELARERNIHPIKLNIIGIEKRLGIAQTQLDALQKQAEDAEKAGSPTLAAIKTDIQPAERDVLSLRRELAETQGRMKSIQSRFDADKKRFLELSVKK